MSGLPWFSRALEDLVHGAVAGRLFGILSSTGAGKTLFHINSVARWLDEPGVQVCVVATEEAARYTDLLACRAAGVRYRDFFYERLTPDRQDGVAAWRNVYERHDGLHLLPAREPTLDNIVTAVRQRVPDVLVVDHLHHLKREGCPLPAFVDLTMSALAEVATTLTIPVVFFSQVHRPQSRDPLYTYRIPTTHSGLGTSKIEQDADVLLGLSRKLRDDVDKETMVRLAKGLLRRGESIRDFEEPGTMRVTVLKHRLDDEARGKSLLLTVRDGTVRDRLAVVDGTRELDISDDDPVPF